ncbi:efflux RND transporter periplasmic adaptor subunit [Aurantimonas sp. A3-2-R12]|uniref:efflux RND transporter periplasmic adaptor subunit n=1 Tax=Aurantimonas sp. A3-2-R12 TaxID=3114362 RepID=UPI002E19EC4C|nr:efflux RND transporter periplasmic adaptor subunit [Aurantimonas sp. A3-2-R12]
MNPHEHTGPSPVAESEPAPKERKSRAGWLAALFVLALVGWMGSGYYYPDQDQAVEATKSKTREPFKVEAFASRAKPVVEFVAAEGQVLPDRTTPVRAKVGGTVEAIAVKKGDFLEEGALIAKIALADREAQRIQAEAELARRQGEFDRVSGLANRGYTTAAQVEEAQAELAKARASLAAIEKTTGDTEIRAPITGTLDRFDLDLGEFVAASAEVGIQIDNDPLTVDVEIAQQNVARVRTGQSASVTFITGETRQGTVRYIAANASSATRTFPVEITVPNPKRDIPAGISAQVRIPVGEVPAHFLSAAVLALGSDGTLGVKAVNAENKVTFHPIELVRAETTGLWVAGLPETLRIITVGQGFVSEGEDVRVIEAKPGDARGEPSNPAITPPEAEPVAAGDGILDNVPTAEGPETATGSVRTATSPSTQNTVETAALTEPSDPSDPKAKSPGEEPSIQLLQRRLRSLGYEPGPIDGLLGDATREAIKKFQRDNDLDVTGEITATLANALFATDTAGGR